MQEVGAEIEKHKEEMQQFQTFVTKVNDFSAANKLKVTEIEKEIGQIGAQIDAREQEIEEMKAKFDASEQDEDAMLAGLDEETKRLFKENANQEPIESKVRHLVDEETEAEDAETIERIMADIEEAKAVQEKYDTDQVRQDAEDQKRQIELI